MTTRYGLRNRGQTDSSTSLNMAGDENDNHASKDANMDQGASKEMDIRDLIMQFRKETNMNFENLNAKNDSLSLQLNETSIKTDQIIQENAKLKDEVTLLKNKIANANRNVQAQNDKIVQLETYMKRQNLIFDGIQQDDNEICERKLKKVLVEKMEIPQEKVDEMKFDKCYRLKGRKPQPLIVRFNWFKDRMMIFKNKAKLAGKNITLREDFPNEIINDRQILYPIMVNARKLGHFAELRDNKLLIDRNMYSVDTLDKLPPELDPAMSATKQYDDVTAFYGRASPLSNFFQCDFKIGNDLFTSLEQYFQYEKCRFAEEIELAKKVKSTNSPSTCKSIGKEVKVELKEWIARGTDIMLTGARAKFHQNKRARDFLLKTGETTLAEATLDKTWGTGLKLDDEKNGTVNEWSGNNHTGKVLMKIREELKLNEIMKN